MRIDFPKHGQEGLLRQLWQLAFGDSEAEIEAFFSTAYSPDRCLMLDGGLAAVLYWLDAEYLGKKIAYLYAIATHPDCRGRGLCRRLMEDTHGLLTEQGYAAAMLMPAGAALRGMYRKMGYRDCCTREDVFCAAGEKEELRRIGTEEYAALRRKMLPEGGVIQEGENLSYLTAGAALYTGDNFLLAAVPDGDSLLGLELLGNREVAPGILTALGCREGTFRVPGKGTPTAMILPLREDTEVPSYFGLTFD